MTQFKIASCKNSVTVGSVTAGDYCTSTNLNWNMTIYNWIKSMYVITSQNSKVPKELQKYIVTDLRNFGKYCKIKNENNKKPFGNVFLIPEKA